MLCTEKTPFMANDLKRAIAVRVRAAREAKGWSQEALAAEIARSTETVSNVERAKFMPGIDVLREIARALGVPLIYLIEDGRSGEASPARMRMEERACAMIRWLSDTDLKIVLGQIEVVHRIRNEPE
jgi:ribosome-binding protein aMBF1 (putative translation factor)